MLPVAVPVRQNGFGDWIKNAASTVMQVVRPMIRMSGNPMLNGLLSAGDTIYALGKGKGRGSRAPQAAGGTVSNTPSAGMIQGNSWVSNTRGPTPARPTRSPMRKTPPPIPPRPNKGPPLPKRLSQAQASALVAQAKAAISRGRVGKNAAKNARKRANKRAR